MIVTQIYILMKTIVHGKLVAKQEEQYTTLVFQNLDESNNSLLRYITTVKLPNWNVKTPNLGDIGFVECEYVNAGDEYIQRNTGNKEIYKYTQCYFLNWTEENKKIENNSYKF